MNRILPILFLFFTLPLLAQITVTDATFPLPGDTLRTATDPAPQGVIITSPGGDQTWDFSGLQGMTSEVIYGAAEDGINGGSFPTANLLLSIGLDGQSGESYARSTPSIYELIGFAGMDPLGVGLNVVVPFNPPIVERRSPMNFFDINNTNSAILFAFSTDSIPEEILGQLPITPDSIRVSTLTERTDVVDGWGTLTIPGGTYNVLREKRRGTTETRLEAKVGVGPFSQWVDITDLLPAGGGLGTDTTTTYTFVSDMEKEAIAQVTVSNDEEERPTNVVYKANDVMTNVSYINTGRADIMAYPNPAIDRVRINFVNINTGNYTFRMFNILGKEIMSRDYRINGNRTVDLNIDSLQKGTYLYNLTDAKGKIIRTKRLMVIRP